MKLALLLLSSLFVMASARSEDAAADREAETVTERPGEPEVRNFRGDDPEMNAAMREARATLPEFEKRLKQPPPTQEYISLKGRFEEDGHVEHMWLEDVQITPQGYRGKLGNRPVYIQSIGEGSEVEVTRAKVSDWMAIDAGKLVGGYTVRVQRARMSDAERAQFDASFGVEF
jgi:uncharacterized protein YegJ (DUF2314 family)